jgi:hypothetical protein
LFKFLHGQVSTLETPFGRVKIKASDINGNFDYIPNPDTVPSLPEWKAFLEDCFQVPHCKPSKKHAYTATPDKTFFKDGTLYECSNCGHMIHLGPDARKGMGLEE